MRLSFFIPMVPPRTTFQAKQLAVAHGKPIIFDSVELKQMKSSLRARVAPYAPSEPLTGPVQLITKWCWPCGARHSDGEYKPTKPDTDNLIKALKDVMEDCGFFAVGDQQVASEVTEKFWAEQADIYVALQELSPGGRKDSMSPSLAARSDLINREVMP